MKVILDVNGNWRKGTNYLFGVCGELHLSVISVKLESVERKGISKRVRGASD